MRRTTSSSGKTNLVPYSPRRSVGVALLCCFTLSVALVAPAVSWAEGTSCPPVLYEPPQLNLIKVSPEQLYYAIGQVITFSTTQTIPSRVSYKPFYNPAKDECESNPQDWQEIESSPTTGTGATESPRTRARRRPHMHGLVKRLGMSGNYHFGDHRER